MTARLPTPLPVLLVLAVGCVPKGRHELVQVQLDATRTAMNARQAACVEQADALGERVATLSEEVEARQQQLDLLTSRAERLEGELSALHGEWATWARAELPPWPDPKASRPPPEPEGVSGARAAKTAALEDIQAALRVDADRRVEVAEIGARHAEVLAAFEEVTREGWATVRAEGPRSVVSVPVSVLFQEGRVVPSPLGEQVMSRIAAALGRLHGRLVTVEGHTDDVPRNSLQFPSNWELGFGYAANVLRTLQAQGVASPISAASFAGTRPLDPADSDAARKRNRRVELVIAPDPGLATRFAPTPPSTPE